MARELAGKRIAFLVANEGVEQAELTSPREAVTAVGAEAVIVAPNSGKVVCFRHLDKADSFVVDQTTSETSAGDFDAIVLPGGVASADQLRSDERAIDLVRACFDSGLPVAVICHGPWSIIEADKVRGRTLTSWPTLQTDIRNAGGTWLDSEVHVCRAQSSTLISSRKPDDLPAFNKRLIQEFAEACAARTH